jgi:mRNA-degrading endonuclease RelE of RelBE toxin-antitoxin system
MRIALAERFQRDVRALPKEHYTAILEAVLSLPSVIGEPHRHSGLGIRKLHRSGIWEARVGLGIRIAFAIEAGLLVVLRVGTHEDIQRYLREI